MRKKQLVPALVLAALLLGLLRPVPVSAANLYFTAVNDSVLPLTSDTMPSWSGGVLYVPYTAFDAELNGIGVSLGLYASYNRNAGAVTLFSLRDRLVFDMNSGVCRDDRTGTTYPSKAIMRNGRPYLALNMVCSFFDLEYSYIQLDNIPQGYLVRIKSPDAVMDDAGFIDRARELINNRLREYTQSLSSAETTTPVSPVSPPAPAEVGKEETAAYLAFCCRQADGLSAVLNAMDGTGRYAVFFLTPQLLEQEGGLVRRILGTGHSIGILTDGEGEAAPQLERGGRALEAAAHARTTLACVPAGQRGALEDGGWICWRETAHLSPGGTVSPAAYAAGAVSRLDMRRAVYLTMEGDAAAARVLPALLRQLDGSKCVVSIPMETRL